MDVAKALIKHGADVNSKTMDEMTVLHLAVKNGDSLNLRLKFYHKQILNFVRFASQAMREL